jgi:hypothetical protein
MEQVWPGMSIVVIVLIYVLIIWSAVWKAFALWRAARNHHLAWYICMCIFNTAGILEIIYIFGFSKKKSVETTPQP